MPYSKSVIILLCANKTSFLSTASSLLGYNEKVEK